MSQYVYDAFNAAVDGTASSDPFCLATDGFLCPRPRMVVSPAPVAEGWRERRDRRDLLDIARLIMEALR